MATIANSRAASFDEMNMLPLFGDEAGRSSRRDNDQEKFNSS
jgi:hypothetical protein